MKKTITPLFLAIWLAACSSGKQTEAFATDDESPAAEQSMSITGTEPAGTAMRSTGHDPAVQTGSRKIVRNGSMRIEAENEKEAENTCLNIDKLITQCGGLKTHERKSQNGYCNIRASIPATRFDSFVDKAANAGSKVTERNITAQDMTERYTDVDARLKNKETALEQYRQLMKKAAKMSDIIALQSKMDELQEEIEAQRRTLMGIDQRVANSEIEIDICWSSSNGTSSLGSEIAEAASDSMEMLKWIFLATIRLLPLLLMAAVGYAVWKRRKK